MTGIVRPRRAAFAAWLLILPATLAGQDSAGVNVGRIAVPPPLPPPWRFQLDIGFQDIAGNRDLTVANGAFVIERRPSDRLIANLKLDLRYGRSSGIEAVNSQSGRIRFDWHPRRRLSPFLGLDMARDRIRRSVLRLQGGTGVNINLDTRDARRTWLSAGVVWDHQVFTDTLASVTDLRWMLRAATQRLIGQGIRIEALAKIQPSFRDAGDYVFAADASLRMALSRKLGLMTKLEWDRDSRPPAGVKRDDRSLSVALSFAW